MGPRSRGLRIQRGTSCRCWKLLSGSLAFRLTWEAASYCRSAPIMLPFCVESPFVFTKDWIVLVGTIQAQRACSRGNGSEDPNATVSYSRSDIVLSHPRWQSKVTWLKNWGEVHGPNLYRPLLKAPRRVFSVYELPSPLHGGSAGSNPARALRN